MIGFVIIAGAVLLGTTSALLNVANQVSAQITPSASSVNELGFMAQNTTDPVQNTTAANITQLATVLPTVNQPIAPTSFAPSDESTSSSNNDDDDDSNSDNNGEDDDGGGDSGDDDSGDDDRGDGNGGVRSASAGGAFASAG